MSRTGPVTPTSPADRPRADTAPVAGAPARPDKRLAALRRFALSITALTIVGQLFLGFEQAWIAPVAGVLTAYAVELLLETVEAWSRQRRPRFAGGVVSLMNFLLPAHIAGLACALLIYGNSRVLPTMFAVTVAIASKYLFRVRLGGVNSRPRHILNPSNAGIGLTFLIFPAVGMLPPYMFTEGLPGAVDWIVPAALLGAGTMLNAKLTGRIPLILAWVGGFGAQALLRGTLLPDVVVIGELVPMTGAAFVLFTNYMITDPGTTPESRRGQIQFGLATAATYGLLMLLHVVFAIFWALALVCLVRLVWYSARNHRPMLVRTAPEQRATAAAGA